MDLQHVLMLFGAGVVGGSLSGLVGGASLVTFPVMLAIGLPPVTAAASNVVAMIPASIAAAITERSQLPPLDRSFAGLVCVSLLGAMVGAVLLVITPQRVFEVLVPFLVGFATVLFACSGRVSAWLRARAEARGGPAPRVGSASIPMMVPVSIYGGYFGAGVGVLALAVMSIGTGGDYRSANLTKNIVMGLNTIAAAVVLSVQNAVSWPPTLVMMAGAVFGGLMGAQLSRIVPPGAMRLFVVAFGALLTAIFAWRYWF
jgi:uncharacterized membrane protein YfcA